jgi:hypothetical protein
MVIRPRLIACIARVAADGPRDETVIGRDEVAARPVSLAERPWYLFMAWSHDGAAGAHR